METIGSAEMADAAYLHYHRGGDDRFRRINSGSYRVVFLGPDDIVYKVPHDAGCIYHAEEEAELFTMLDKYNIPWGPKFTLYENGVTAMPRYGEVENVQTEENRARYREIVKVSDDVGYRNLGLDENGLLVIIDGGMSYSTDDLLKRISSRYNGRK